LRLWFYLLASAGIAGTLLSLSAQVPRVGDIDLYGNRKVSADKIQSVLRVHKGDPLPRSKSDLEDELEKIPGVVAARIEAVCCDGGAAALFVGIQEKGAPHFALRSPPAGSAVLPKAGAQTYRDLLDAVASAARRGDTAEDLTQGHSLMADPAARALQEKLAEFTGANLAVVRDVLRNGAEPDDRAMAAAIIGYAPKKQDIIDDLQSAMQDPDEAVRANAMRSLTAVAVLARLQPDLELRVAPTWFIEMLNSLVLSDRTRAAKALVTLTDGSARDVLDQIRDRALDSIVEMARWPTLRSALPAYILLGRIGGSRQEEIEATWSTGLRDRTVDVLLKKLHQKR